MTDIPEEVVEAVAKHDHEVRRAVMQRQGYTPPPAWEKLPEGAQYVSKEHARELLRVGLEAWPKKQ